MFSPKNLILLLALLWAPFALQAQSCFIQENDATGSIAFSTAQLAELEAAACSLREVFPEEFQSDFAVYDFGFYLHQESYVGGVPQVFQDKIAEVEQESPYFLLFGRQLLRSGALGKVWVEVRLPEGSGYPCATSEQADIIEGVLRQQLDQSESNQSPDALASAVEYIETHIDKLYNCCSNSLRSSTASCEVSEEYIEDILSANGYFHYGGLPVTIEDKDYQAITSEKNIIIQLDNRCGLKLYGGVQELHLTDDLEDFVLELESAGKSSDVKVYYYDDYNAHEFLFDHLEGGEEVPSMNSGGNAFYREEIFVLEFEGSPPKVYFSFTFNGTTTTGAGLRAAGVPWWMKSAIKWFFKRASTNPTTVVVGIATEYAVEATFEYWFNNEAHEDWFSALYEVGSRRGWYGLFVSAGENIINSPAATFLAELAKYCLDVPYDDWNGLAALQQAGLAVLLKGIVSDEMLQTYPLARKISADIFDNPALFTAFFNDLGLITIWKEVNALGTAFNQVRKDPSFLNRFKGIVNDGNLNKHVFEGDLKFENGSIRGISGVHSKEAITVPEGHTGSFAQGDVRFKSGTKDPINPKPYEYYTAKVEVMGKKYDAQGNPYDGWHSKKSTFFPDSWSKKKVQAEIAYGFQNKQFVRTQNNGAQIFHGEMTDGTTIEIVMNNGMIDSAYPNLNIQ